MKILVPVKRVIDAYVSVRVKSDGSGVDTDNVKMSIESFLRNRSGRSDPPERSGLRHRSDFGEHWLRRY